jgi:hypothetical protein
VSFVASPQASATSIEADTTAKPFFDERPIQGFFNTIRQLRSVEFGTQVSDFDHLVDAINPSLF